MKRFLILLIAVLSFSAFDLQAQVVNLKGKIILKDRNGVVDARGGEGAYVFIFNTAEDAKDFISEYKNSPTGVIRAQHVAADHNGEFSCSVLSGGHIVIYNPSTKKDPINHTVKSSDEGRKLEFTFADDGITLQGVDVNAKKILTSGPKARKARGFGKYLTWTCDNMLVANQANHDSRLVVQPYAIDCQTEDTIQLMPAFVIEGTEYHNIQRRRMDYDYSKNDSVANYFIDTLTVSKDELSFTKTLVFEKPDPNRSYYCTAKMWLEDYSHVYWETEGEFGSCFVSNPFKFMNFKLSGGEMPLDPDEFFEVPTSELRENNKSLQIQFPINRSEMADTEANQQQMEALLRDLHSYGNRLAQVRVIGYASPDGNYERNQKLAADRAQSVMQVIRRSVDSRKVQLPPGQAVVCTWDDEADSLVARGFVTDAEELRGYAKEGGSVMAKVKNMIIFDTVIDQILQNQRKMYCSYMYSLNSQLTAEDAVRYYRTNPAYGEGGQYRFSHGDWFNIIANTTDSLEQKKIIDRVYREITKTETGYEYNAFAAYVANRKALDVIRAGGADTTILKPFIDYAAGANVTKPISYFNKSTYVINRPAILANQAVMFMRLGDSPMAEFLVSKLTGDMPIKKEVGSYIDMMNWVLRMDDPALTDEEREKGREGFAFVCEQDSVNNAILKAELYDDLGYDRKYVTDLVKNNLKDDDARKWYLLGMLKSKDAIVDDGEDVNEQPEFVGYMEKAIAMNPAYARYYASEANIPKAVFERYPIKSAPKAFQQNVSDQPISIGNGLERYKLEHRWRPQDAPFRNKFFDHMWLEGGFGMEFSHQKSVDPELNNPLRAIGNFYFGIGKQLHPFHSIRLMAQAGYSKRKNNLMNYFVYGGRLDYMFSLSQYIYGYNPDRVFDVSAVFGAGMTISKVEDSDFFSSPVLYAGLNFKIKTGPYGYLSFEPNIALHRDVYDLAQGWSKVDVTQGMTITYQAYLNSNNTFDRPEVKNQKWRAPWFIEAGNGIDILRAHQPDSNTPRPGHDITFSIGKWLSPMLGIRAGFTAISSTFATDDTYNYHRMTAGLRADAMFNPFGASKNFSWDNPVGFYLFGGGYVGRMGRVRTDFEKERATVGAASMGAHLWVKLENDLQFFVEPRYSYIRGRETNVYAPMEFSVNFGLSMYLRSQHFRAQDTKEVNALLDQDEKGWRAGVAGGISLLTFSNFSYAKKPATYIQGVAYGEYHFDDFNAFRLSYEHMYHRTWMEYKADGNQYTMSADPSFLMLDYMVNLTNLFGGHRTDRRFQLGLFGGPGLGLNPGFKNPSFALNGGAKLSAKMSDHLRIVFLPTVYFGYKMKYIYGLPTVTPKSFRYFETVNVGVEYKF